MDLSILEGVKHEIMETHPRFGNFLANMYINLLSLFGCNGSV